MKISKLFHWLYAVIMLLPIFAIGVTCGYAMFNKNAYQSYSGEQSYNEKFITNTDELRLNNGNYTYVRLQNNNIQQTTNYDIYFNFDNFEIINTSKTINSIPNRMNIQTFSLNIIITLYENTTSIQSFNSSTDNLNFKCIITGINNITNTNNVLSNNNLFYTITDNNFMYIDNVFYYSIDKVQQSPLFNWAENSFLVAPFAYIVSLFSMPTNSPIVMFLSYWLAISIIWLVFDLIMYIPLLVHRWLDKGVLE